MNNILIDVTGLNGLFDKEFENKESLYDFLTFILLGVKSNKENPNILMDNDINYLCVRHSVNELFNSIVIDYVHRGNYEVKEYDIIKMLLLLTEYKQMSTEVREENNKVLEEEVKETDKSLQDFLGFSKQIDEDKPEETDKPEEKKKITRKKKEK